MAMLNLRLLLKRPQPLVQILLVGVVLVGFSVSGCSPSKTASSAAHPLSAAERTNVTSSLLRKVANRSNQLYILVKGNHWQKAEPLLQELDQTVQRLDRATASTPANTASLKTQMQALHQAADSKDRVAAMQSVNQVMLESINLAKQTHASIPVDLAMLSYYSHKLETAAIAQNTAEVKATTQEIDKTWNQARSQAASKASADDLNQMDQLVNQIKNAKTAQDSAHYAPELVKAEKKLERELNQQANQKSS